MLAAPLTREKSTLFGAAVPFGIPDAYTQSIKFVCNLMMEVEKWLFR